MELISLNLPNPPEFRMAGATSTLADPSVDLIQALVGLPTAAGKPVTRYTAVRIAAFMSGVKMLAQDLAKMPLILRETQTVNDRQRTVPAINDPLYPILMHCPNDWQTSYEMRFFLATQLLMSGNCYCQKITDQTGKVIKLIPLNAWGMSLDWDLSDRKNPVPLWRYEDQSNRRVFKSGELWRVTNVNIDGNGVTGTAIIAL